MEDYEIRWAAALYRLVEGLAYFVLHPRTMSNNEGGINCTFPSYVPPQQPISSSEKV